MDSMMTRSKARQLVNRIDDHERVSTEKKYITIIDNLKKKLKEQEVLNTTLLQEQETNEQEYETLCKQVQFLKKKVYDEEQKGSELNNQNSQLLDDNCKLKEFLMLVENQDIVAEKNDLELKINGMIKDNTELHRRYSELLLHTTSSTKNGFKCSKKRIKNARKLKNKLKKTNTKIRHLTLSNQLMNRELHNRDCFITKLEEENQNFLALIKKYEHDLKERDKTYEKIMIIEEKLLKLKGFIEKEDQNNTDDRRPRRPEQITNKTDYDIQPSRTNIITDTDYKDITMFSDTYGRNISKIINVKLPFHCKLQNICKPYNNYQNILDDGCVDKSANGDYIILIGDYNSIKRNVSGYLTKIYSIAKVLKAHKRRLIISTISYGRHYEENLKIWKLNSKLFALSGVNENMKVIDINDFNDFNDARSREDWLATNILTAYCEKKYLSNMLVLTEGGDENCCNQSEKPNFLQSVILNVVR